MTASLGAALVLIMLFFVGLGALLTLAVHMESTLEHPRGRHRVRVPVHDRNRRP
ncbi:hypothetical protein [Aeromicrobium sp. 9AM]|uniref:hypothetical protein n=1 Tax=Aeromicrobium sp. 9AM TaxID=2653126 RepID=UPI0012F36921|nr:hypothetical protein [Aeromicrobium sp. 9AM]VXB21569.1 hypothetical protein AERO9AM_10731 [Aeromicrobium sp. 9AM]